MIRLLPAALWLIAAGAGAQAVQDPTRPPAQLVKPSLDAPLSGAPQLQSILVARGAGGRRVAVIDGAMVRVGDKVRGARVVAITQGDVQLARGGRREVLKMTAPEAEPAVVAPVTPTVAPPPAGKPE